MNYDPLIETWKNIEGFEGKYFVSTFGRVKSKNKILAFSKVNSGYYIVHLVLNGNDHFPLVHTLVWNTFREEKSIPYVITVDHDDNNKLNNRLCNLRLLTLRDNQAKQYKSRGNKTSIYTGVSKSKGKKKWHAQYILNKKTIHLGDFENEYDAHVAYQNAVNAIS